MEFWQYSSIAQIALRLPASVGKMPRWITGESVLCIMGQVLPHVNVSGVEIIILDTEQYGKAKLVPLIKALDRSFRLFLARKHSVNDFAFIIRHTDHPDFHIQPALAQINNKLNTTQKANKVPKVHATPRYHSSHI